MMMTLFRFCCRCAGLVCLLFGLLAPCAAGDLPAPAGSVILTVSGRIANTSRGDVAEFDLAQLKALPQGSFKTRTIWTEGENQYTGVPLLDLLKRVGATGKTIRGIALNDYAVDIPVADAVADGPLVVYAIDGQDLPIRSRGPLWIVYPFDAKAAYRSEIIYSRSIWQLSRIVVRD